MGGGWLEVERGSNKVLVMDRVRVRSRVNIRVGLSPS